MSLKKTYLKFKLKLFPAFFSSNDMNNYLLLSGIKIGMNCRFYRPSSINVDITRPIMLEIGDYVKITSGVTILAHDYSRSVLRRVYGEIVGEAKKTIVGNNVFIGMNSVILMGSKIGDNVIIGAGSIVSGVIPSNCVVCGNPAKVIMSLDEYYQRRKNRCIEEAKEYIRIFKNTKGRFPKENEMLAFWPLYAERDISEIKIKGFDTNLGGDDQDEIIQDFLNSKKTYESFEELLNEAFNENSGT